MTGHEEVRFARLAFEELSRVKVRDGIGLLAEKRLHGVLKRWICEDETCHEQKVPERGGKITRFVADILTHEGEIFEIQTGSLYPMRKKLAFYMEETDFTVTVVHPLLGQKWISWLCPATGEVRSRKKSPLHETPLHAIAQLRPYVDLLGSPRFSLCLPVLEVDEYRLLDGWSRDQKRGSHRYELMPMALQHVCRLRERADYLALLPADLPAEFTARAFGKLTRLRGYDLYNALAVFESLGAVAKIGKVGNAALYAKQ